MLTVFSGGRREALYKAHCHLLIAFGFSLHSVIGTNFKRNFNLIRFQCFILNLGIIAVMDINEYRVRGKEMVDYIAEYLGNIRQRRVLPDKKPGFLRKQIPESAPLEGESWPDIFSDIESVIMPGVTHWQSPHMHAYFPALNCFPSLLGDMLADAINCLGFTWASSPVCTELEMIVMDWLGKMIGLPDDFLHLRSDSMGGGVIQTTSSEATLVCLLAGRCRAIKNFQKLYPDLGDVEINARLVAYCSDQSHSSVEKAGLIGLVRMRYVESDENYSMRGNQLMQCIKKDRDKGLIPFWVCATLGTTGACAFDNLEEISKICTEENLWLHIDAAYAGSAFICPEFRLWLKGIEHADSIAFNPSKWLMIHFDCTALWVKDSGALHRTFNVDPLYLKHENSGLAIDYMGVRLAQKFEALVAADSRFEIPAKRHLGLVVFRLAGENDLTEKLLKRLNSRGNLHCVPAALKNKYVIRFTVTSQNTTIDDILKDWLEIKTTASEILTENEESIVVPRAKVPLGETKERNENFGTSLLLANSPMSPKIVNGSFVAIYDQGDALKEYSETFAKLHQKAQNSPAMRRRIRGILMSGKQFSLDSRLDLFHGIEPNTNDRSVSEPTNVLVEDSNENEDTATMNCGDENDGVFQETTECPEVLPEALLPPRHCRSRSVDHQVPIVIGDDGKTKKCVKCGHEV